MTGKFLSGAPGLQVAQLRGEIIRRLGRVRVERHGRAPVRARGAADAKVDPPGRDGLQHAELLGDFECRVMRQHDPGAAERGCVWVVAAIAASSTSGAEPATEAELWCSESQ